MMYLAVSFSMGEIAQVAVLGLLAGVLGGMLGVGGSVVMIPGLVWIFGSDQHVYQGAAMIANVAVSIPAAKRHHQAGAVQPAALKLMLPAALVLIFVGVALSDLVIFHDNDGVVRLQRVFALFLIYVTGVNVRRLIVGRKETLGADDRVKSLGGLTVGGVMGLIAGLLGVGGGAIAVPLQQMLLRLPLRNCIANSAAVICVTAGFGALYKNYLLGDADRWDALTLALTLAPTCVLGGHLGGALTHKLPIKWVRAAFIALMLVAAWKMADPIAWVKTGLP